MDAEDEAYYSGFPSLPELDKLKAPVHLSEKDSADKSEALGSTPLTGVPSKPMNIGSKLLSRIHDRPPGKSGGGGGGPSNSAGGGSGGGIKSATTGGTEKISFSGMLPSAVTPTSHLVGRLSTFSIVSKGDGMQSPLGDSPTSEYASGSFPSLIESDPGYVSLPPMISLNKLTEQPPTTPAAVVKATEERPPEEDLSDDESMDIDSVRNTQRHKMIAFSGDETAKIDIIETSSFLPVSSNDVIAERVVSETSSMGSYGSKSPSPAPVSLLASSSILVRGESPTVIPPVGENIEIITEGVGSSDQQKQEGFLSKRKAGVSEEEEEHVPSSKNPRLSPETMASKKAIRVSTIVSSSGGRLSPRPSKRKSHSPVNITVGDHSPTHSSNSTNMDTSQIEPLPFQPARMTLPMPIASLAGTSTANPMVQQLLYQLLLQQQLQAQVHHTQSQSKPARVNFKDIQDMSKSDRPFRSRSNLIGMENQSRQGMEQLRPPGSPATRPLGSPVTRPPGSPGSRSPVLVTSPLHPMHVDNLISSPRSSRQASSSPIQSRSLSPHSPRDKTSSSGMEQDKDRMEQDSASSSGMEQGQQRAVIERGTGGGGVVRSRGEEAQPSGKQNALLKVSEAHLAILPDEDGDTPLHLAVIHENVSLTRYLIRLIKGVHTNLDISNNMRQTPLHLAVITKQSDMVQILIEAGASVNYPDRKGNSALHLAAVRKDIKILKILSKATSPLPNFNGKNFAGLTVVHVATKEASIDVLKLLFQMGSDKNTPDSCSGRGPIHYAVEAENFILVNFLLESSCNVNAPTFSGNTPLHIAAGRRLKEIVALLMAYGANPALANGEGDFPSDLPASLLMQRAKLNAH